MRHAVHTRNLSRSRSWRKATVRSLAQALLRYEKIETTLAKAKEAQRLTERLITLGKGGSLADRRQAIRLLNDPEGVRRLFSEIAPRFSARRGGFTRILHSGSRHGDGASLAVLELVERAPEIKKETPRQKLPPPEVPPRHPEQPKKRPEKPKELKERPKGFLEGVRKFFKGRPKQP